MRLEFKACLAKAVEEVCRRKPGIVAVQVPEGLKPRSVEIASELESKSGAKVFVFVEPCFGACDLADQQARALGADLLVHFGHSRFLRKEEVEVVYLPLHYSVENNVVSAIAANIVEVVGKGKAIALCSTIQYLHVLPSLVKTLERKGLRALVGDGDGVERGQVLGCNYSSVRSVEGLVDAIVFFGDGLFHALGASFCCRKPVFVANPLSCEVRELKEERELFLKRRRTAIAAAMHAESFGILLSTKRGQLKKSLSLKLKEKIESKGRKAFLLAGNLIKAEHLLGLGVEAFISTACPRIAFDDASSFKVPILTPIELLIALGEKGFNDYCVGEFA